jgi:hypothetical protein|tara:strand:- start:750 stop:869 length:120 start_codon:yes stop_codon:yes gene_type:complete
MCLPLAWDSARQDCADLINFSIAVSVFLPIAYDFGDEPF